MQYYFDRYFVGMQSEIDKCKVQGQTSDIAKGISSFSMHQEPNGTVILKPFVEIPVKEKWLFENSSALQKVRTGLGQGKNKELVDKGSFSQFSDDEIE